VATFLAFEIGSSRERSTRSRLAWWIGWFVVGLTALTKGPLAVIAPVIWIGATWIRRRDAIRWASLASGAFLASLVGGSWFAYMAARRGSAFVGVNNYEFLQRYFDQSFPGPARGPLFYLSILPGEIAPWTLVIAAALIFLPLAWNALDRRSQDAVVVSVVWFVGVLLICSFSHYKLPHYALPAYPPLMLLTGFAIDCAWRGGRARRVVVVGLALTACVFVFAGAASILGATWLPAGYRGGCAAIGLALLIGGVVAFALLRPHGDLSPISLATATAVAYGIAAVLLLPSLAGAAYPYPALGRLVAEKLPPSVALGSIGAHTALVYYADRPVSFFATPSEAAQFLDSSQPRLVVLSRSEFAVVRQSAAAAELASRRRQNPRLSRLLEGRFMNPGTEELLIGNPAAVAVYSDGN
jgi:hypothetical protein